MLDAEEVWLDVPGYVGLYRVSSLGRVLGVKRGKVLSICFDDNEYGYVNLCKNGKARVVRVHVIVALAFLGGRPDGLQIRHVDDNKLNNSARNLAYGSVYDNYMDSYRAGRFKHKPVSLRTKRRITALLCEGSLTQQEVANMVGVSLSTVNRLNPLRKVGTQNIPHH